MMRFGDYSQSIEDLELWKHDRYLKTLVSHLPKIQLISFDIFDTLLLRASSKPSDIFLQVGERASKEALFQKSLTKYEYASIRTAAEIQARDKRWKKEECSEVTLKDIYQEIPQHLGQIGKIMSLELEVEKEICYLNPNVSSLLFWCKEQEIKVALVSDMYLSGNQIKELLSSAGLNISLIDTLLVSNEQQCDKRSGALFDKLFAAYPEIPRESILHIGDNEAADVHGAKSRQIQAIHYNIIPESFEDPFHWESIRHGNILPEIKAIRKLSGASFIKSDYSDKEFAFHEIGAGMVAPFLNALCEWTIDLCIKEKRKAVHPLMREGFLLGAMLEKAVRLKGVSIDVKPLYVSRQATYLPSLNKFGTVELDQLLSKHLRVKDVFDTLQIQEEFAAFQEQYNEVVKEDTLISGRFRGMLSEFLLRPPTLEKIYQLIIEQRKFFMNYVIQECGPDPRLVTLDIGFYGTIQKAIDTIFQIENVQNDNIHLLAVGTSYTSEIKWSGHDVRCFIGSSGEHGDIARTITRTPAFLEELSMGSFGTTLRYEEKDQNLIRPVVASLLHNQEEFKYKEAFQNGIRSFQMYYDYFLKVKKHSNKIVGNHRSWSLILHRLIDMPSPLEAQLLGDLTHQDNYSGQESLKICSDVEESFFKNGGDAFLDICNYGSSTLNVFWPQGLLTRRYPYFRYLNFLRIKDSFGHQAMFSNLMLKLKRDGIKKINVYGSGEILDYVISLAYFHGVAVEYAIDPLRTDRERPWGSYKYSTLEKMMMLAESPNYVVASLINVHEKKLQIEHYYNLLEKDKPEIFIPEDFNIFAN